MDIAALPAETVAAAVERLGVAAIIVVGSYYLIKYFITQLAAKDKRLDDLTDRFIKATETMTIAVQTVMVSVDKLTVAVDSLHERRTHQRP